MIKIPEFQLLEYMGTITLLSPRLTLFLASDALLILTPIPALSLALDLCIKIKCVLYDTLVIVDAQVIFEDGRLHDAKQ